VHAYARLIVYHIEIHTCGDRFDVSSSQPSVPQDSQQRLDLPNVDVVVSGADNAESGADAMHQADDAPQNQTNAGNYLIIRSTCHFSTLLIIVCSSTTHKQSAPTGTSDQPRGVCAAICEPDRSKPATGATGKGGACVLM